MTVGAGLLQWAHSTVAAGKALPHARAGILSVLSTVQPLCPSPPSPETRFLPLLVASDPRTKNCRSPRPMGPIPLEPRQWEKSEKGRSQRASKKQAHLFKAGRRIRPELTVLDTAAFLQPSPHRRPDLRWLCMHQWDSASSCIRRGLLALLQNHSVLFSVHQPSGRATLPCPDQVLECLCLLHNVSKSILHLPLKSCANLFPDPRQVGSISARRRKRGRGMFLVGCFARALPAHLSKSWLGMEKPLAASEVKAARSYSPALIIIQAFLLPPYFPSGPHS